WIMPIDGDEAALNPDFRAHEERRRMLDEARERRAPRVSRSMDLRRGGKGFMMAVPILREETLGGFIVGIFRTPDVWEPIVATIAPDYAIAIMEGEEERYSRDLAGRADTQAWAHEGELEF